MRLAPPSRVRRRSRIVERMSPSRTHIRSTTFTPGGDQRAAGRAAMERGEWEEARSLLQAALARDEAPETLEDLGLAAWWLDDARLTFDARERAYTLYRERDDARGAARVAVWLVWDNLAFRGDFAVASGWLERARRILEPLPNTPEFGWLAIREGEVALFRGRDPQTAIAHACRAATLGRELRDAGVEFTALALEGLARVSMGDVGGGMRYLDEAGVAATAGEIKELHAVGLVCCWQVFACERVRDFDRAVQWCARAQEFTRRWRLHPMSAVCRTQYAGVLIWRGAWSDAEAELLAAAAEVQERRPGMAQPPLARLGILRLRQGRLDEAERLFEQSSGTAQARLGAAELTLERGNAFEAAAQLDEVLAKVGAEPSSDRAAALELMVRAQAQRKNAAEAARHFAELRGIAHTIHTAPYLASCAAAEGVLLRLQGDLAAAATCFEQAIELFQQTGAPFETARAQLELSDTLALLGREAAAAREARRAVDILGALGAEHERLGAVRRLRAVGAERTSRVALTRRQLEILRLVAQGSSNPEIAARLGLSEHTVKRHVANLLSRLGVTSRAAAAAYAAREKLL